MNDVRIDSVIPYITLGAVMAATSFFTFYYHYVKDEVLKRYRNFLWPTLGYILIKEFLLTPKYTHEPLFLYLLSELLYWGSLFLYIRFIYITIDFKKKIKTFRKLADIAQLLLIFAFLVYLTLQLFFPSYTNYFEYMIVPVSLYMLIVVILFILHLYRKRIVAYYNFFYVGSIFFLVFNTIGVYFDSPEKQLYGLTNFSILCTGWFLELIMFMVGLCIRAKNDWDDKLKIITQNATNEKKLLIAEIERQHAVQESRHTERLKISIDIHDGISNAITGLKFYISDKRLQSKNDNEKELLKDLEYEVNSIYIQVRDYIQKLYYGESSQGFDIVQLLDSIKEQYKTSSLNIKVDMDRSTINKYLTAFQLNELYFVLNESIGNAVKHSGADQIIVNISFDNEMCYFSIEDNGIGFNYKQKLNNNNTGGLGLSNVLDRMEKLHGHIQYHFSDGTKIFGSFPYFK
ncbi:sensor histidine kinase [Chryseobacterium oncorhynchi]|uniref:histidine kinase n=1 Tax=Chryseobacterium oncorhynchi TaxID=741074 RepID=A0A316WG13_9FLAO|nr:ATP-binding protein [Chryseobacterium oncorhynchi]PWN60059.1 hypothetical protein C1638_021055 [Chryseobacterium oncorhynchi]